jgi:hypothetical protein
MNTNRQLTPPNQSTNVVRQSTPVQTPLEHPGFIQTNADLQRSVIAPSPAPILTSRQSATPQTKKSSKKRPQVLETPGSSQAHAATSTVPASQNPVSNS